MNCFIKKRKQKKKYSQDSLLGHQWGRTKKGTIGNTGYLSKSLERRKKNHNAKIKEKKKGGLLVRSKNWCLW